MLLLARHGEAALSEPDESRALTPAGQARLAEQTRHFDEHLKQTRTVLCSPYLRARQSAALLRRACPLSVQVVDERWQPQASVAQALASLEEHWDEHLLVVGHQPLLGLLVSHLLEGTSQYPEPLQPGDLIGLTLGWPGPSAAMRAFI